MRLKKGKKYVINYIDAEGNDGSFKGIATYIEKESKWYVFYIDGEEVLFSKDDIVKEYKGEPTHFINFNKCWVVGQDPRDDKKIVIIVFNHILDVEFFSVPIEKVIWNPDLFKK
jgi:hypothetical protein